MTKLAEKTTKEIVAKLLDAVNNHKGVTLDGIEARFVLSWKVRLDSALANRGRKIAGEEPAPSTVRSRKSRANKKKI